MLRQVPKPMWIRWWTEKFLTNKLSSGSTVLPWKLTGSQLVKIFSEFYETRRFHTTFTTARHLSLSWARSIQSMSPSNFAKNNFNIILALPSGLFPSHQHPVCTSSGTLSCYSSRPSYYSLYGQPNNIWFESPLGHGCLSLVNAACDGLIPHLGEYCRVCMCHQTQHWSTTV